MGLLTVGKPLSPEETFKLSAYIRDHGITQFLNNYHRVKDLSNDDLRYGDEIECGIFCIDSTTKEVRITLRSAELRAILIEKEELCGHQSEGCTWHPEFGAWMIESTPSRPYTNYASDLLRIERNMILRRSRLLSVLAPNEIAPTVTTFPLFGVGPPGAYIQDAQPFTAEFSESIYAPDYVINPHPRFSSLTRNIRCRRGSKVDIQVPLFRDTHTPEFLRETNPDAALLPGAPLSNGGRVEDAKSIHMDAMCFGMGLCCLQVTFQGRDIDESRYIYDQLAVLAPIMLSMTAASPIFKGRLADVDCRWDVISQSVDDRTPAERGILPAHEVESVRNPHLAGDAVRELPKSRYGSISTYIYHCRGDTNCQRTFEQYNDIPCPVDEDVKQRLRTSGIDENLAHHLAHLFTRDPLVLFEGMVDLDDYARTDHFENIQSTNWQSCRWKPPPPRESAEDPHIGWRTELRSMEVQLTDFENAAFTVFVVLITRVVLAFDLALYVPLSKVDENMKRAQLVDSVRTNTFFFRKYLAPLDGNCGRKEASSADSADGETTSSTPEPALKKVRSSMYLPTGAASPASAAVEEGADDEDAFEEMTMAEIFHGKGGHFPGLLPLVYAYLDYIQCDPATYARVDDYLQFISRRAKGETMTAARWMRNYVTAHPSYRHDSVVTSEIAYDLMMAATAVGDGSLPVPEILGDIVIDKINKEDAYGSVLKGQLSESERSELLRRYTQRAQQVNDRSTRSRGRSFSAKKTTEAS